MIDRAARAHERALGAAPAAAAGPRARTSRRRALGSYYTPSTVVERLLDLALDPLLDRATAEGRLLELRICDPACGAGAFLAPAAARLARRLDRAGASNPAARAVAACHGWDIDPDALALCAAALRRVSTDGAASLTRADALLDAPVSAFDLVIGNPPFHGQLTSDTVRARDHAAALRARWGAAAKGYADSASIFLAAATAMLRAGGTLALVQPQSVLAARDARGARVALQETCALTHFWATHEPLFHGTDVRVCALIATRGAAGVPAVALFDGRDLRARGTTATPSSAAWSSLLAAVSDVPEGPDEGHGVLGDLALITADFRDAYYGLLPGAVERADAPPGAYTGVTVGRIAPMHLLDVPVRYGKRPWESLMIDVERLDSSMQAWAARRGVPKLLVATQTRVIEVVADPTGTLLPITPVISVVPRDPSRVWHIAAALTAPGASAWALRRSAGAALGGDHIKLSAADLRALPLPPPGDAWDRAASELHAAHALPAAERRAPLLRAASALDPGGALGWWRARLPADAP